MGLGPAWEQAEGEMVTFWRYSQESTAFEKQISYIKESMWNLEKWYKVSYLQSRNGDTDTDQIYGHQGGMGE